MSQNASTPPSRPPSSASAISSSSSSSLSSSITSTNNLPRVHASGKISYGGGHDHTRPLPPPRLSEPTAITTISSSPSLTIAPLTAPLAPLSANASFRSNNSRNSTISGTSGTATTSNNNNNLSNNNINNNNNNNSSSSSSSSSNNNTNNHNGTSPARQIQSSVVASPTNSSRQPATRANNLGEVTLTVPRPELERVVNEYVETPFRQGTSPTTCPVVGNLLASNQKCLKNERRLQQQQHHHRHNHQHHHHHHHHHHHERELQSREEQQQLQQQSQQQRRTSGGGGGDGIADSRGKSPTGTTGGVVSAQARNRDNGARRQQSHLLQSSLSSVTSAGGTITKQPVSFTKEPSNVLGSSSIGGRLNDPNLSIMCDFCGRCRCESCREPPPLPSRWLCDNSCFCSAETALDYASCLCCVKGLFYHCADSGSGTDSEAGGNCADEPCSCTGPRRTARWACLGALTLVLPCLLCYWPLKGCVTVCEACYARHASQGCRCDPNAHGRHHNPGAQSVVSRDSRDPEKRLLDPVTPEL